MAIRRNFVGKSELCRKFVSTQTSSSSTMIKSVSSVKIFAIDSSPCAGAYAALQKWGVWGRSRQEQFTRSRPLDSRKEGNALFRCQKLLDLPYPLKAPILLLFAKISRTIFLKSGGVRTPMVRSFGHARSDTHVRTCPCSHARLSANSELSPPH